MFFYRIHVFYTYQHTDTVNSQVHDTHLHQIQTDIISSSYNNKVTVFKYLVQSAIYCISTTYMYVAQPLSYEKQCFLAWVMETLKTTC
jgi:hypothetical protein